MIDNTSILQVPKENGEYPIEPKVAAARLAAFFVSLLAAFLLKTLPVMAGIMPFLSEWAGQIITDILLAAIVAVATFWAGFKAKHAQRPAESGTAVLPTQKNGSPSDGTHGAY